MLSTCLVAVIMMPHEAGSPLAAGYIFKRLLFQPQNFEVSISVNYLALAFLLHHFSKLSLLTLFIKTFIAFILH
jgi:hypothetical protein